jgi:hypothetical protein
MADVSGKFFSATKVRTGVSPSSPGTIVGETLPPVNPPGGGLNSVGLTMPSAFAVANSPLTANGTIGVTGAGTTAQYIRGDGTLETFPSLTGFVPYTGATADVNLGSNSLAAEAGFFDNNGSSDALTVTHTSGSGYGIIVTKGGNNEALYVEKTSGSGNAMRVLGGRTSLVDLSLSSVSNATGNFLTISGGVVHQRTPSETRSDVGAQAQLNGTGFVKASGTTITYDNSTYQVTSDKGQPNGYASLDSNGKVPLAQINDALIGNVNFQGLWNAATNTPTLANPPASGTKGYYYIVSTAGTFAGISFEVGDWIISSGSAWQKIDNTDAVSSVFGRTGNVVASNGDYTTAQVTESGNLYYTNGRARGSLSFVAGSGAYNSTTGVITIPTNNNQITNGAGYITSAALSGYLPLTGGTLTGPLGGTSASFSGDVTANRYRGVNSLVLNSYTTVNPSSNVFLYSQPNDRDSWIYLDSADTSSNWGIYHRQIDTAVSGLPGNSIGFIGGGTNTLQSYISLLNGNGFFAGNLLVGATSDAGFKLDVNGTGRVQGNFNVSTGGITLTGAQTIQTSTGNLTLSTAGGNGNIILSPNGTGFTQINSPLVSRDIEISVDTNNSIRYVGRFSSSYIQYGRGAASNIGDLAFYTANSSTAAERMRITSGGNVLIATTTDAGFRLTVGTGGKIATYRSGNDRRGLFFTDGDGTWLESDSTGNDPLLLRSPGSGGSILFYTSTTEKVRITSGGNLLIGTTTDNGARLQVNGTGTFTSSVIAVSAGLNGSIANSGDAAILTIKQTSTSYNNGIYLERGGERNGYYMYIGGGLDALTFRRNYFGTQSDVLSLNRDGTANFSNLSGSGNRIVVANSGGTLISAVIGSGLAFDGTTLTATGGSSGSISGSGTSGTIALFTGTSSIGNSVITQSSGQVIITGTGGNQPLILNNQNNQQYLFINSASNREAMTQYYNATAGNWYTGIRVNAGLGSTSSYHIFSSTFGDDVFVLNTDGTARFVGGVGIGVAPATNFHVQGPTVSYGQIRFLNTSSSGEASIHIGRTNQTLEQRWTIGQGVAGIGDSFGFYTGGSSRVNFLTNGNVLIGTTTDNGNRLRVNGTIFSDSSVTATSFFESSDATIKTLVEDDYQAKGIDSVVAKLYIKNGKQELGYYAQDLEGVLPSAVSKGSNGLLNLSYREVHTAKIAYLEQQIKELRNELLKPS